MREILGCHHAPGSVLLADGYAACERYAQKVDLTHAQCWAHAHLTRSKPWVEIFFDWIEQKFKEHGLKPPTAFTRALEYARSRRAGLSVFLTDPDGAMDTSHLERVLNVLRAGPRAFPSKRRSAVSTRR